LTLVALIAKEASLRYCEHTKLCFSPQPTSKERSAMVVMPEASFST
jgi:hypothetical protein